MQNIKAYSAPLPYITWGFIQDLKTKRRDSDIYILKQLLLKQKGKGIIRTRRRGIQRKIYSK